MGPSHGRETAGRVELPLHLGCIVLLLHLGRVILLLQLLTSVLLLLLLLLHVPGLRRQHGGSRIGVIYAIGHGHRKDGLQRVGHGTNRHLLGAWVLTWLLLLGCNRHGGDLHETQSAHV